MKIDTHPNTIVALGLFLLSICAVIIYAQDQKKANSFAKLTAQTMEDDLPSHRFRSSPIGPKHEDPRINEMLTQLRAENYIGALELTAQLIATQPENVTLQYYAGSLAHRTGDSEAAKKYFQNVRMNSDLFYRDALKKLALLYYEDQQSQLCRQMLQDLAQNANDAELAWSAQLKALL